MSKLYPLSFIVIAGASFYAGYNVGIKKAPAAADQVTESAPVEMPETVTPAVQPVEVATEPTTSAEVDQVVAQHDYSLRAKQTEITFTDTQGRELVAEVISASKDSLKVRRTSDRAEINLPVAMLCDADREFAAYLVTTQTNSELAKQATSSDLATVEDKVWEELFK